MAAASADTEEEVTLVHRLTMGLPSLFVSRELSRSHGAEMPILGFAPGDLRRDRITAVWRSPAAIAASGFLRRRGGYSRMRGGATAVARAPARTIRAPIMIVSSGSRRVFAATLVLAVRSAGRVPPARAHDIPADVRINAFVKPDGKTARAVVPGAARRPDRSRLSDRGPGYPRICRAPTSASASRYQALAHRQHRRLRRTTRRCPRPASSMRGCRCRPTNPSPRTSRRARTSRGRRSPTTSGSTGTSNCSTCCSNIRSDPTTRNSRSTSVSTGSAATSTRRCASCRPTAPSARSSFTAIPVSCASIRSWHQAALRFVVSGFWHILEGTDHLLFLRLPRHPVPPAAAADHHRHLVHGRAFDRTVRLRARFRARGLWFPPLVETLIAVTIVYMALENIVYAALNKDASGELSRRWIDRLCVRNRARLRLFIRARGDAAIRRRSSPRFAGRLQYRRRDRPDRGARWC